MIRSHLLKHLFPIGASCAIVLSWTIRGGSEPAGPSEHQACLNAYKSAQELGHSGHFRQARELVDTCVREACGYILFRKCASLSSQMTSETPSVVPVVTDEAGKPRIDVRVTMDGEVLTSRLDGRAVPIDPGLHEFSFSVENRATVTRKIMIGQGERNRAISISLGPSVKLAKTAELPSKKSLEPTEGPNPTAPATTEPSRPGSGAASPVLASGATEMAADSPERWKRSTNPYWMGGVGVAGIGGFALLTLLGSDDNAKIAADLSLGIGIVGIGAAVTSWFLLHSPQPKKGAPHFAYSFDVKPTPTGSLATVSGSF